MRCATVEAECQKNIVIQKKRLLQLMTMLVSEKPQNSRESSRLKKCLLAGKQVNAIDQAQEQTLNMFANTVAITIVGFVVVAIHSLAVFVSTRSLLFTRLQGFPESAIRKTGWRRCCWCMAVRQRISAAQTEDNHQDVDVCPHTK